MKKLFVPRSFTSPPEKGESEGVTQKGIYNKVTLPNLSPASLAAKSADSQTFSGERFQNIDNFEFFTDSHVPDISSTEIRRIIPEHSTIHARFEENPKFIIPGLSKRISQYILQEKLYLEKPKNKPKILVHVCC